MAGKTPDEETEHLPPDDEEPEGEASEEVPPPVGPPAPEELKP